MRVQLSTIVGFCIFMRERSLDRVGKMVAGAETDIAKRLKGSFLGQAEQEG
jgi:hypothetical protein